MEPDHLDIFNLDFSENGSDFNVIVYATNISRKEYDATFFVDVADIGGMSFNFHFEADETKSCLCTLPDMQLAEGRYTIMVSEYYSVPLAKDYVKWNNKT